MTKRLRAPEGTDEANVGEERFPVHDDGTIEVPDDAADALMKVGGFTEVPDEAATEALETVAAEEAAEPSLLAKVQNPDKTGCSWGGHSYEPDADGVVHVPHAAVADLTAHGFEAVE